MNKLFQSNRIQLRSLSEDDASSFSKWSEDGEYLRGLDTDFAKPRSTEFYKNQIQSFEDSSDIIQFGIYVPQDQLLIGFISLHSIEWNNQIAFMAIGIGEAEYRKNGYGSEAIQLLLKYAFYELNLHKVELDVISNNDTAIFCYRKNGFETEGVAKEAIRRDNQRFDKIYMGILARNWKETKPE
ncbi:GNAT family N-acetyltransferase [Listeria welshimeri]|uniref:GNAT family N-acetyltransferase n=1 Tax=Listeria welshimeri TaxID=1643 RepID=UPI0010B6C805|nr:GNAT family protein [Listeria welshimeri]MBC1461933.1 GNAT family N-acetyltransferase [Listeria welshimeri]MBC1620529.1 GNAT family N-acetyltransferase [Listeria welshimeri]MBC1627828.1 GNAT family N-acetyltransferase [Listeria welshimeri]MBC1864656.1 GNAT family N-acetyltransferase [Listeria welshimeri]MBC1940348.1 GNAT family N-acetyltransferase [Listeria welshimeri]